MKTVLFILALIIFVAVAIFIWGALSDALSGGFQLGLDQQTAVEDQNNTRSNSAQKDRTTTQQDLEPTTIEKDEQEESPQQKQEKEKEEEVVQPEDREGSVIISSVNPKRGDRPAEVRLTARLGSEETVSVTNWKLVANDGQAEIPNDAVDNFKIGGDNDEEDLILKRGDRVKMFFKDKPLPSNIRLNMCTGYLNNIYDFDQQIPERCPGIDREAYKHLSGRCQSYIDSLGRCEVPSSDEINSFGGGDRGNECREFLQNHFNAGWCYREFNNNSNFLDNVWWVWIENNNRIFDSEHDWVRLINSSGKIIDEYVY